MAITKKQFLARALLWKQKYKDAPNYKDPDFEGGKSYEYEGDDKYAIFNWARREFPYYNRFSDNKELTQRFFDDYQRGDQQLLKDINQEATATEDQIVSSQPAEAVPVEAAPVGESASTMAGMGLPSMPSLPSIHNIPRVLKFPGRLGGKEGGTGTGTAATNKATGLTGKGTAATAKAARFQREYIGPATAKAARIAGSKAGVFFQRNVGKYLTMGRLATVASTGIGAFAGATFGGAGAWAGGIAGAALPSWVKSGGAGKFFGKAGNGVVNFGARLSNQAGGGLRLAGPGKKIGLIFLGSFLLFGLAAGLLGALNPGGAPTGTGTGTTGTIVGTGCPDTSINTNGFSCRYLNPSIGIFDTTISQSATDSYITKYSPVFINAGKGDLAEFAKRTNYIVTNSQQAGLNPAIFLGYWKTESLFSTIGSRDLGCAGNGFYEEVDCALGINKFSDPIKNPIANCARSKDADSTACKALKSLRQTYDKTHPVKYPIASFDDFAESYGPYGHLTGGLPTNCISTYNKLLEVSKELNVCKPTSLATTPGVHPAVPTVTGDLAQAIKDQFGIAMVGFTDQYLRWAWEKFWDISNTKFISLVKSKSPVFTINASSSSYQPTDGTGCQRVFLTPFSNPDLFKIVLLHELGHVIYWCNDDGISKRSTHAQTYHQEGAVTGYGEPLDGTSCTGTPAITENYPEMLTYYLNQGLIEQTASCTKRPKSVPYANGKYPLHFGLAKSILGEY